MPRAKRICPKPGCPSPADGRYCPTHTAEYEAKRGNSNQRGYGIKHQQTRQAWAPTVQRGDMPCAKCGLLITLGQSWHLGHTDDRTAYTGPEHERCNTADGGRRAHPTIDPT